MIEAETTGNLDLPLAIPRTANELMKYRKIKKTLSDVDRVDPYFMGILESVEFKPFLNAMDDGKSVEGSMRTDDQEIARLVRAQAKKSQDLIVGNWPLDRVRRAVGSVMRRYSLNLMRENANHRATG